VRLATLLLLTGIVLGPQGLAVLTPGVIEILRPAVAVALTVLGVTMVFGRLPSTLILAAALSLALLNRNAVAALAVAGQAAGIAILLAGAGWMLSSARAGSDERRVFAIAVLLLLGGVADYLSMSALLLGWIAAAAWRMMPAKGLADVRLDAAYVQHPTTALLLITAGAMAQVSWEATLIAAAGCTAALTALLMLRWRRSAGLPSFSGVQLVPATFVVALVMDAARIEPRLVVALSAVVLAMSAFDIVSGLAKEATA
jgi:hypothetical protein